MGKEESAWQSANPREREPVREPFRKKDQQEQERERRRRHVGDWQGRCQGPQWGGRGRFQTAAFRNNQAQRHHLGMSYMKMAINTRTKTRPYCLAGMAQ